jgi:hypothetical protein
MRKTVFPPAPHKGAPLSPPSGKKYQPKTTPFIVTPVRHLLLEAIRQLKLLNAEQLTRRYYKAGSLVTVKNRLTVLTREKYVDYLQLPTTEGNGPYLYFLARNGRDYFQELEEDVKDFYRPGKEKEKHYATLMHLLELNDVVIAAQLFPKFAPAYSLVEFQHDLDLQHEPFYIPVEHSVKALVEGVIRETWHEETLKVIPDALLEFRRTPSRIPGKPFDREGIWLEHNRTGGAKRFKPKIRAMLEIISSGAYRTLLDVDTLKVAITTSGGEYRKRKLRTWTEDVLAEVGQKERGTALSTEARQLMKRYENTNIFYFAATPPFGTGCIVPQTFFHEKVWYQPFSAKPVSLL